MIYNKELKSELNKKKYDSLSGDQQRDLVIRYRNGDLKAKELLMNSGLRLIYKKAEGISNKLVGFDALDLFSEGYIYFEKKIDDYDLEIGSECKFVNYAINNAIAYMFKFVDSNITLVRVPESSDVVVSTESIDNVSNDDSYAPHDPDGRMNSTTHLPDEITNKEDSINRIKSLMGNFFTPIEAEVLNATEFISEEYVYFDDLMEKHGMTKSRLYQIRDRAREKFIKKFGDTPQKVFSNLY